MTTSGDPSDELGLSPQISSLDRKLSCEPCTSLDVLASDPLLLLPAKLVPGRGLVRSITAD